MHIVSLSIIIITYTQKVEINLCTQQTFKEWYCRINLIIYMLRISNLVRKGILKTMPMRAGLPNWDRPDPPPSAVVPLEHELTDEQIVFTFFDRNMPEFFLTQPEVYEGDTLLEATPMLLKGFGVLFGFATLFGLFSWLTNPIRGFVTANQTLQDRYEKDKKMVQSKQWLQWAKQNPLQLSVAPELYPVTKTNRNSPNSGLQEFNQNYQTVNKINNQVKTYFLNVKQRIATKIKKRNAEKTHQNEHAQQSQQHNSSQSEAIEHKTEN